MIFTKTISSPIGNLELTTSQDKVLKISLVLENNFKKTKKIPEILIKLEEQLNEYFNGERKIFDLDLDFSQFSLLQIRVYKALIETKYGVTLSYKQLGQKINCKAYRFIGTLMAKNPFPIIIPCHRVILSNKKIGKYSFGDNKSFFLELEKKFK